MSLKSKPREATASATVHYAPRNLVSHGAHDAFGSRECVRENVRGKFQSKKGNEECDTQVHIITVNRELTHAHGDTWKEKCSDIILHTFWRLALGNWGLGLGLLNKVVVREELCRAKVLGTLVMHLPSLWSHTHVFRGSRTCFSSRPFLADHRICT